MKKLVTILTLAFTLTAINSHADSADLRSKYYAINQVRLLLTEKISSAQNHIDKTNKQLSELCTNVDNCENTKEYETLYQNLLEQEEIIQSAKLTLKQL